MEDYTSMIEKVLGTAKAVIAIAPAGAAVIHAIESTKQLVDEAKRVLDGSPDQVAELDLVRDQLEAAVVDHAHRTSQSLG